MTLSRCRSGHAPDAFPMAPDDGWGWVDFKKKFHSCESPDTLITAIRDDRDAGVDLVWMPGREHMILPEEMPDAAAAVLAARKRRAADDLLDSLEKLRWFGGLFAGLAAYMFYQGWSLAPRSAAPGRTTGLRLATRCSPRCRWASPC